MVSIPIKLYTATEEKDVRFNLLHTTDHSRIKQKRFCAEEDIELEQDEIVRGYEVAPGQYVTITDDELKKVAVESTRTIDIQEFVSLEQIDPIYYDKTYYVEPDKLGQKQFALLRSVLAESDRVAIAKVTFRSKEQLCSLRVIGDVIALETMLYADEVRSTDELELPGEDVEVSERDLKMARSIVEMMSGDLDIEQYTDTYREALLEMIEAKSQGETVQAPAYDRRVITDLTEALRQTMEQARKMTKEDKAEAEEPAEEKKPRKLRAAG
jgi:DNA end-binding protein Ku